MSARWQPGAVALVTCSDGNERRALFGHRVLDDGGAWIFRDGTRRDADDSHARPLAVIDFEDPGQVEQLARAFYRELLGTDALGSNTVRAMTAALRDLANPAPDEPTDPRARATDRRENIWRLLADGDWVCTSGPDIGEYITWPRLAAERGPISVEVIE